MSEEQKVAEEVIVSKEDYKRIGRFISTLQNVSIFPSDSLEEARIGSFFLYNERNFPEPANDVSLYVSYRFAKPVTRRMRIVEKIKYEVKPEIPYVSQYCGEEAIAILNNILTKDGWYCCDNPKELTLGFVKYAGFIGGVSGIFDPKKSKLVTMSTKVMKSLCPQDLQDRIEQWREKKLEEWQKVRLLL